MADSKSSGMAKVIREAQDSELTLELAGYSETMVSNLIKTAFGTPLERAESQKITFVVGGGKLVRSKFDDNLQKWVTASLRDIGFDEDRAADKQSVKCYKTQHDTSKNLKFVHVFPDIITPAQEAEEEEEEVVAMSPERRILLCTLSDFHKIVGLKVESYKEKKAVLQRLKSAQSLFTQAEAKLTARDLLDEEEQDAFDNYAEMPEKIQWLTKELETMVSNGSLDSAERADFVQSLEAKLQALSLDAAEATGKKKKALEAAMEKLSDTKQSASKFTPIEPRLLKREQDLRKFYGYLKVLVALQNKSGNKTIQELNKIGEIPEIEEAIELLKRQSRGWFEEDDDFEKRVQRCKSNATKPQAKAKAAAAASGWTVQKRR